MFFNTWPTLTLYSLCYGLVESLTPEGMMIVSLHPHHHHVVDVTPEEELESCSGGHCAITGKSSTHENKVRITVHSVNWPGNGFIVFNLY